MSKRKKKIKLRPFGVSFESHRYPYKFYNDPVVIVDVNVEASSVKEAITIAGRKALRQFIDEVPDWVSNVLWAKDPHFEGCGYIAAQSKRPDSTLSKPYNMTKRLQVTVTLGRLPKQLELEFE